MKKQKLSLNEIKVESFVTSLNQNEKQTVEGGDWVVLSAALTTGTLGKTAGTTAIIGLTCAVGERTQQNGGCGNEISDGICTDSNNAFCWYIKSENAACSIMQGATCIVTHINC